MATKRVMIRLSDADNKRYTREAKVKGKMLGTYLKECLASHHDYAERIEKLTEAIEKLSKKC